MTNTPNDDQPGFSATKPEPTQDRRRILTDRRLLGLLFSIALCVAVITCLLNQLRTPASALNSTTRYVVVGGNCGGASPCYPNIQDAVDDAAAGDTIKVAHGVYTTTGLAVIYVDNAITITGGYAPGNWTHSYPITQPTVIDAENAVGRRGILI